MKKYPLMGWMFVAPAVILIVTFLIYPTIRTIELSFYNAQVLSQGDYIGLDNYINLFTRDRFFFNLGTFPPSGAVFTTVMWLVFFPTVTVGLGLIIAVLSHNVRYEVLVKSVIFVPMAISFTAAGIIWQFVYNPNAQTGVLNAFLSGIIPGFEPIAWLGRADIINFAIMIAGVWLYTGFCMVIISAAYKGLPTEVLEAARVDGANAWNTFRKIVVPMLWPTIVVVATTMIINTLKAFDLVFIMTNTTGGPRKAAAIIGYSMYDSTFQLNQVGKGSAIAVIMLIVVLPFVYLNIRRFRAERQ